MQSKKGKTSEGDTDSAVKLQPARRQRAVTRNAQVVMQQPIVEQLVSIL